MNLQACCVDMHDRKKCCCHNVPNLKVIRFVESQCTSTYGCHIMCHSMTNLELQSAQGAGHERAQVLLPDHYLVVCRGAVPRHAAKQLRQRLQRARRHNAAGAEPGAASGDVDVRLARGSKPRRPPGVPATTCAMHVGRAKGSDTLDPDV